jgi:uncharacterized membrane protein
VGTNLKEEDEMNFLNKFRRWYVYEWNDAYDVSGKISIAFLTIVCIVLAILAVLMFLSFPQTWIPVGVIGAIVWVFFKWVFNEEEKN